jgi:hypothetical protein
MEPYLLTDRDEYNYCIQRGYNPLLDLRNFRMDIRLRVEIQRELFGHCITGRGANIMAANERFFRWVWDNKPHQCEECLKPLRNYSAVYCSHILTRGAYPEAAHDARNINILCFEHHNQWENGDKSKMRIYPGNIRIIELIKKEYGSLERDRRI